jgi:hypothetical protein
MSKQVVAFVPYEIKQFHLDCELVLSMLKTLKETGKLNDIDHDHGFL